jgi:two-component system chemotaxis sensor kinase CheA
MKANLQEQLINDLLIESFEGLDGFDRDLLVLESGSSHPEILNRIFRVIHTIKGTAGCLGLQKIEKVAHVGENLLSLLRENQLAVTGEIISTLLAYADVLREMLRCLEANRTEGDKDYTDLLNRLVALQNPTAEPAKSAAAFPAAPVPGKPATKESAPASQGWGMFDDHPSPEPAPASAAPAPVPPAATGNGWGLFGDEAQPAAVHEAVSPAAPPPPNPPTAAPAASSASPAGEPAARGSISESAIRVDVGQLDRLMNLVGELVLARNQITQHITGSRDTGLLAVAQRLNLITSELQEGVMKTRMQPIDSVLSRFPRIVRDVAGELGKQVRLELAGRQTELDRTIIESIKDPLTHVVRNSIDHGIETPERRTAAGKAATGLLFIRAYHEGGQVNIEIADDGGGINTDRVKQKALDKGLITPEQAARMSDREACALIFLPGLSTAEKITNVSGRGVGMDVVKTNIERIGGSVDIQSDPGQGTTIKFKIPLTLAIIPALVVTSGGERFAIPQVSLLELVRVDGASGQTGIERIFDAPVYRLRGKLLPLVYLNQTLAGDGCSHHSNSGDTGEVFLKARDAHRAWVGRLRQVLDGRITMTIEEAGSHRLCLLGKWIYSEGLKDYGDLAEVRALEQAHEQFHNRVREIVALKNANESAKAEERLLELTALSARVLDCLVNAEKRVLESQSVNIVVLQADGRQFGLVVDAVNDTQEIVVKPLGKQLKGITCFAGATIMGDGRVALILDVLGLAQHAAVLAESRGMTTAAEMQTDGKALNDRQTLLVFEAGLNSRFAMPLSQAARLEEFPRPKIEHCGNRPVVQYRGSILPLIDVAEQLGRSAVASDGDGPLQVVVFAENGRSVGLVVGQIIDIVEESVTAQRHGRAPGILGSALVSGRVTDLLNVREVIEGASPAFFSAAE